MARLDDPKMVYVICRGADEADMLNREVAIVHYLMVEHPGHVFLCRGCFLHLEQTCEHPIDQWADFYVNLVDRCDALYCVDGYRDHPLADFANDNDMPQLDDYMDLELFLSGLSVQNPE